MKDLSTFKKQFDLKLAAFFNARLEIYKKLGRGTLIPEFIKQHKVIALGGGKRFRPYLTTLTYETFGGKDKIAIEEISMGLEVFHLFALAHDDIVDKAFKRHSEVTAHIFATQLLSNRKRLGDIAHIGQGQGMLAGDLLLVWAEELMVGYRVPSSKRMLALQAFREIVDELFVGEMIDIDLTTQRKVSLAAITQKNLLKTAHYTFTGPMTIGARFALGNKTIDRFSIRFGEALGSAYQIQDDLLDATGKSNSKDVLLDISGRQHTHLTFFLQHKAKPKYRAQFKEFFGKPINQLRVHQVQELYLTSGAVKYAEQAVAKSFTKARHLLAISPVPRSRRSAWQKLIDIIENRKS
jgi:geranylgeranyl diphosphate synthase type I